MEQYRFHKTHISKKISEMISDTVDFPPKQFNIPKMSSIDAAFHVAEDLIYAIHNPAPENRLSKIINFHKEEFMTLAEIFDKSSPPAIPLRVPVIEKVQEKPKEVNQERAQLKILSQATPSTNVEHLSVPIVEACPEELSQ